jgi:pimeloyl-ACP methyl ester carboxylesterase
MKTSPANRVAEALARHPLKRLRAAVATVSYREAGAGDPLLLLHGISSSSASWIPVFEAMPNYHLVAWDAPGYGESDALTDERPSAAQYAERLAEFADALGLRRFALVGHSLGALIAAAFAASRPGRVSALILSNPGAGYRAATEQARRDMVDGRLGLLRRLGPAGIAEQRAAHLLSPHASAEAIEWVRTSMRIIRPAAYVQAVHMLAGGHTAADARNYNGPVLVLAGSADFVTPPDQCRALAAELDQVNFNILTGLGHVGQVEKPGLIADTIAAFLRTTAKAR